MDNTSLIRLDRKALKNNLNFLRKVVGSGVKISSVVKSNAYGHGIAQFVTMAVEAGINHFSVFEASEAREVRKVAGNSTIMIMGYVSPEDLEWAIRNDIEFFVFDKKRLRLAVSISRKTGKRARIHVEIETGMNRTGFALRDLPSIIEVILKSEEHLFISGICTHYAGAENMSNYYRIRDQIAKYHEGLKMFSKAGIEPETRHTACSAASIVFPETCLDMVRIGIMQYGLWPSQEVFIHYLRNTNVRRDPLKRVISWSSHIMSIREVSSGEYIGYGSSFMAQQKMKLAVIPVGYGHGYSRELSNSGRVLIHGRRCLIVGRVNMNMMIADITGITGVKTGDPVVLIGKQEKAEVTLTSFSEFSNSLNYESLVRLPKEIPRVAGDN